jgi:3-hydroxymyristoyl/3-hydroxydecanoyl-(acyl carrier protein) dehydratase
MESREIDPESAPYFMGMNKVKFRRPVVPGDQLIYDIDAIRTGSKVWKVNGVASVEGEIAAEAEMVAQVG